MKKTLCLIFFFSLLFSLSAQENKSFKIGLDYYAGLSFKGSTIRKDIFRRNVLAYQGRKNFFGIGLFAEKKIKRFSVVAKVNFQSGKFKYLAFQTTEENVVVEQELFEVANSSINYWLEKLILRRYFTTNLNPYLEASFIFGQLVKRDRNIFRVAEQDLIFGTNLGFGISPDISDFAYANFGIIYEFLPTGFLKGHQQNKHSILFNLGFGIKL